MYLKFFSNALLAIFSTMARCQRLKTSLSPREVALLSDSPVPSQKSREASFGNGDDGVRRFAAPFNLSAMLLLTNQRYRLGA